jgi:hypothetical protein
MIDANYTASPEAKHFLVWLHANGFTDTWQAYDPEVRDNYRRSMGASYDHMEEIRRVMEDPYFGRPQPCSRCGTYLYTHYLVSSDGVVVCAACAAT